MRCVVEAHLELRTVRCPRCAGELVIRVAAEERGRSVFLTLDTACAACGVSPWTEPDERGRAVMLTLDTACVACGVSPWDAPDQRTILFTPGAAIDMVQPDALSALAVAQARIDALLRRIQSLENSLAAAHRNLERAHAGDRDAGLREEISRLEGQLAEARAEVRKAEESTRGNVAPGKRPIEME